MAHVDDGAVLAKHLQTGLERKEDEKGMAGIQKDKKPGYFARRKMEKQAKKEAQRKDKELKEMEKEEAKRIQSGERLRASGVVKEASIKEVPGQGYAVSLHLLIETENDASAVLAEITRQVRG